jgi:hypothetical protein
MAKGLIRVIILCFFVSCNEIEKSSTTNMEDISLIKKRIVQYKNAEWLDFYGLFQNNTDDTLVLYKAGDQIVTLQDTLFDSDSTFYVSMDQKWWPPTFATEILYFYPQESRWFYIHTQLNHIDGLKKLHLKLQYSYYKDSICTEILSSYLRSCGFYLNIDTIERTVWFYPVKESMFISPKNVKK